MTLTYPALARAEEILWLVTGASKHDALARLLAGDQSIPAARVQARRSVIFADAPAVHGPPPTFQGAIFDVDGVLVDSPHYRAWREALQELMDTEWADLRGRTSYSPERFTEAVYQQVVAGKPRLAGALAALEYFGVPDAGRRAERYAAAKAGGMAALAVARLGDEQALADAGADLVVRTLDEVSRPALAQGRLARKTEG